MNVKRVNRIDPMSSAKMMAVMYLILGLVFGIIGLLMASFAPKPQAPAGVPFPALGIGMIIFMVIFYPICGFIGGYLGALVYNAAAGIIGGIKIELSDDVGEW